MTKIFACDLDNTLIHSHKRRRSDDICVELYDGHEQSFISPRALDLLKKVAAQILFIPITTRSIAQYQRIHWTEDFRPRYAVTSNGAYLLDGDAQENLLHNEVLPYADELSAQCEKFSTDERFDICRIVDDSFLFLRGRDDVDTAALTFDTSLTAQHTGKKIYLFPPPLNKGNALIKIVEKFYDARKPHGFRMNAATDLKFFTRHGATTVPPLLKRHAEKIFCAGDSDIDLPMLELADVAFAPETLSGDFVTCAEAPAFAEEFLQKILDTCNG